MATRKPQYGAEKKRRSKKKRSRTEVSSSSESDSEVEQKQSRKTNGVDKEVESSSPIPVDQVQAPSSPETSASPPPSAPAAKKSKSTAQSHEDFSAIYLRKITTEVADDLDKVREAPDFKANSIPMLIHALKQGESLYSAEEKRRVVGAGAR